MLTQVFWLYILCVGIKVYSFEESLSKSKVLVSVKVSEKCTCANAICI